MKPPGKKRQPVGDDDIEDDIFDDRSPVKAKKSKKTSSKQTNEDDSLLYRSESYFHHILSECGLTLTVGPENPHILDKDQSVFLKKLNQALLGDSSYPKNVETFREELTEYLDERDHLLGSFIPIKTHRDCKTALRQNQDSLVKLLLQHSEIQTSLFVWLLEKLGLVGIEDGDRPAGSHKVTWVNVPQRILMQFQFLDEIHEGQKIAEKFLEVLEGTCESAQLEIILNLPAIVDSQHHDLFAMPLRKLMNENRNLTNCILDAFTCLSLNEDALAEVHGSILKTLDSTPFYDLPIVTKFVLECLPPGEELDTVRDLREKIDLSPPTVLVDMQSQNAKRRWGKSVDTRDLDTLVLRILRSSLTTHRALADSWLKAIEEVRSVREQKPLDVLMLFVLHDSPFLIRRKSVQSLFKNRIRSGLFTEALIQKTLSCHASALCGEDCFEGIKQLAHSLACSVEPVLNHFAFVIFRETFLHFDKRCKQKIMADLVNMISMGESGKTERRQTGLKTLSYLVDEALDEMSQFSLYMSKFLDYMGTRHELAEVRQIMDILSRLSYSRKDISGLLRDNIHIVVKKQLSSCNINVKRMGIVGAVMVVKNMSKAAPEETSLNTTSGGNTTSGSVTSATTTSTQVDRSMLREARDLLQLVLKYTKYTNGIDGLFMDELSSVIEKKCMHKRLERWVTDKMTNDFQDNFIVDVESSDPKAPDDFLPMELQFNLELVESEGEGEDVADGIALNLCPLIVKSIVPDQNSYLQATMASKIIPHFRLLRMCVSAQNDGDLSDIDAVIGCPVWLPKRQVLEKLEPLSSNEKNVVCATLFYCANWFRELINAFAGQVSPENKNRVLNRLKNLLRVQSDLSTCLIHNSNFVPPSVLHLVNTSSWQPPTVTGASKNEKEASKGKGKGKKSKKKNDDADETSPVDSQNDRTVAEGPSQAGGDNTNSLATSRGLDLTHYAPFFRELDLEIFNIFSYGDVVLLTQPSEDEEMRAPKLRPPELLFLLNDMQGKLEHCLISTKSKKGFPGKVNLKDACFSHAQEHGAAFVAEKATSVLKYLIRHMNIIGKYIGNLIILNDGVQDCAALFTDLTPSLCACYEKILNIMRTLLAWNGFLAQDQQPMLRDILVILASAHSGKSTAVDNLPIEELAETAIRFLQDISSTFINIACAEAQLKLMETLASYGGSSDASKRIISAEAESYLKREWMNTKGSLDRGSRYNGHVEAILKIYLANVKNTGEIVSKYVKEEMALVLNARGRDAASETYQTFHKGTFNLHYRAFLENLVLHARTILFKERNTGDHEAQLEEWPKLISTLHDLVEVPKLQPNKIFITAALKHSRHFIEHFLKHCMPLMDRRFGSDKGKVIHTLKDMQQCTRLLQHFCLHSKTKRDATLTAHVPLLKKAMETFVFRVKSMLALNDAVSAFAIGELKNRRLDGGVIEEVDSDVSDDDDKSGEDDSDQGKDYEQLPEEDQSDLDGGEEELEGGRARQQPPSDVEEESMEF